MNKNKEHRKLVPELRFSEFEGDEEWNVIQIGDKTSKVGSGKTPRGGNKNYKTKGRPFVRSQNIGWGILLLDDVVYIDEETHRTFLGSEIKIDDVLLNITGASIGRSAIANHVITGGNVNQHVCIIRTKKKELNPVFLNQFIISHNCQNQIDSFQAGGNREGLNFSQIRSLKIPLPPKLSEQQKIANTLTSLDTLIAAEKEKGDALQAHKKGLLQQLFPAKGERVPRVRFGEFRGAWEEMTLGEVAKFRRGSFPQPYGLDKWYDDKNGMPFIQVYDVDFNLKVKPKTKRKISQLATSKSVFIKKGTVIITIQGSIGRVAVTQYDAYVDRTLLLFQEFYREIDKLFFAYVLQLLFEIEKRKAPGGIIKTITKEVLTNFNIHIPEILEQQKIANTLSSLDDLIAAQSEKIAALEEHKKGLMQQLFPNPNARKG